MSHKNYMCSVTIGYAAGRGRDTLPSDTPTLQTILRNMNSADHLCPTLHTRLLSRWLMPPARPTLNHPLNQQLCKSHMPSATVGNAAGAGHDTSPAKTPTLGNHVDRIAPLNAHVCPVAIVNVAGPGRVKLSSAVPTPRVICCPR